jgi:hypothetical protein
MSDKQTPPLITTCGCPRYSLPIDQQLDTDRFIVFLSAVIYQDSSISAMKKKKSAKKSNMSIYVAREPCEESPSLEPCDKLPSSEPCENMPALKPCEEPPAEPQPPNKFECEEALQKDATGGSSTAPKESPKRPWTS